MLSKDRQELIDSFRVKCKRHGLNMTPQRVAIYEQLINSKDHPDSDEVFRDVRKSFPDISLDTVYRTLSKFAEIGIVNLVEGYGEAKRYDPDTSRHHHLRCQKCNKIIDFHYEGYDNLRVPKSLQKNFRVKNVKVILEGTCYECAKKQ
jgi:Fur family peroxide stress response transcriptional regulator